MSSNTENPRDTLWKLIKDIRFGMFTTRHGNGHLHSRPMTTQNTVIDDDDSLWFFMSRKGEPVADIATDKRVNLAYADTDDDSYVSVSGEAKVIEDMAKKTELWNKFAQAWFPGGIDDPDLALVQVTVVHAQYWDVKESKIVQIYKMAKAAITGERPSGMGESGEIRMRAE